MLDRLRGYPGRARAMTPEDRPQPAGVRGGLQVAFGSFVLALLEVNDAVVRRVAPMASPWADPSDFPWTAELEAAAPAMRRELDAYLAQHVVPETTELIGAKPIGAADHAGVPTGVGQWRILLLQSFGTPVPANAASFPETLAAVARTPAIGNVGFSCLDPHSHIEEHRDLNRGVLRLQLPIQVPEGDCWIRVGGSEVRWQEGQCVLFDQCEPHEVRNDGDAPRVVLTGEVLMQLPPPFSLLNRLAQWCYQHMPSYDGMVERANAASLATVAR